jgi:transcriptional regulator with PAS, ATPase and Fis domain
MPAKSIQLVTAQGRTKTLDELESEVIAAAIEREGSIVRAARALQISRSSVYRKMSKWAKT